MTAIITVSDLAIGYDNKAIGQDISFSLSSGQVLCVLGPNGSGKSTLFKTILGLLASISGQVLIKDKTIEKYTKLQLAQNIAYVPQAISRLFDFEVIQIVLMGRLARLKPFSDPAKVDYDIARQCLAQLGISHLEQRIYSQLSGGERQLVLIARALAQQPYAIIMDEPTSSLDFGNQTKVLQVIQELSKHGLSVLLCTHTPQHAIRVADQVLLFKNGKVQKQGAANEVITARNLAVLYDLSTQQVLEHIQCSIN